MSVFCYTCIFSITFVIVTPFLAASLVETVQVGHCHSLLYNDYTILSLRGTTVTCTSMCLSILCLPREILCKYYLCEYNLQCHFQQVSSLKVKALDQQTNGNDVLFCKNVFISMSSHTTLLLPQPLYLCEFSDCITCDFSTL